jgi:hypothetical protein
MVTGLARHREPQQPAENGVEIVAQVDRLEHEAVAAILAHALQPRQDLPVGGGALGLVQRAHGVLDHAGEVGEAVGYGRVDGDVGLVVAAAVDLLRFQDRVAQDDAFAVGAPLHARGEDDGDLLEGEQPVGELQVGGVQAQGLVAQSGCILVVRIEHEDVRARMAVQQGSQDHGHRARLAGAGAAQDGEVLAQQLIGREKGRECLVVAQAADLDVGGHRPRIDRGDLLRRHGEHGGVQGRVGGDAGLEGEAACRGNTLAQELDVGHGAILVAPTLAHPVDYAESAAARRPDRDQIADRCGGMRHRHHAAGQGGALDPDHMPDDQAAIVRADFAHCHLVPATR